MTTIPGATETASITWQAMTAAPGQAEQLGITWQAFTSAAPGSQTIAGETVSSDGASAVSATQVAEAAFGVAIAGLSVSGPADWTSTAQQGATTTLLSTLGDQPVPLPTDQASSGSAAGAPAATVLVAGEAASAGGSESIGGETVTGTAAFSASQVAQVAGGAALPGLSVTQAATLWSVSPVAADTTVFTSTTPDAPVAPPGPGSASGDASAPTSIVTMTGAAPVTTPDPAVTMVSVPADGTYVDGQELVFTVGFTAPVFVGGDPFIPVDLTTGGIVDAAYAGGSGTDALSFQVQVQPGEQDLTGIATGPAIDLNGGPITDAFGTPATLTLTGEPSTAGVDVNAVLPAVSSVTVPPAGDYGPGAALDFTVAFTQPVTVDTTGGTPSIAVTLAPDDTVQALYLGGSGTSALSFGTAVAPGELALAGPTLGGTIALGGGTIADAIGNPAALALTNVAPATGVVVDAVPPTAVSLDAQGPGTTDAATLSYVLVVSTPLATPPIAADFQVATTGTVQSTGITVTPGATAATDLVQVDGVTGDGTLQLDLAPDATPLLDPFGNTLTTGLDGQTVNVVQTPPALSDPSVTVPYEGTASLAIAAPVDAQFSAPQLAATVTALPTDGTVSLAGGQSAVSVGEALSVAQLTALVFTAAGGVASGASSFGYSVLDPAGNVAAGSSSIRIGSIAAPLVTTASEITDAAAPSLTGTAAPGSTVSLLEGAALLGTAVASASGSFTVAPSVALAPGEASLTVTASAAGETSAASAPVGVFALPPAMGGVSEGDVPSAAIAAALGRGASLAFTSGTQSVALQDGVLSVGSDTSEATIQRLYEGLLGRAGDPVGLSFYDAQLAAGITAAQVASEFLTSAEYVADHGAQTAQQLVASLYQGLLGRDAAMDPQSAFWVGLLGQGVSAGAVAAGIAGSPEVATVLAADTSAVYVPSPAAVLGTELYETGLGRAPDPASLANIVTLNASLPPLPFAAQVVASAEFAADHARQGDAALVASFYQDGLGRAPDPIGGAFWTAQLTGGASVASVLLGIAGSQESSAHQAPLLTV